ncbi:MAG: hypothetical protein IJ454_04585 [Clostridia bacterium]|nr:hypothetical protein [Clostridia bacterium]
METYENLIVAMLQVLHENYGFGAQRQTDFFIALYDKIQYFKEAGYDGVRDIKTESERRSYHDRIHELIKAEAEEFLPVDIYKLFYVDKQPTNQDMLRENKKMDNARIAISIKEAANLQASLQEMRKWAMDTRSEVSV